ncbi:hypothetical protein H2248_003504 [Termitomyces sp. 'cryptogamus']|nr:hypothetical protein H2248_003504 [Termitomyces sp. 'cryptogamus']
MSQELDEQISQLQENTYRWVDLHGLVTCATLHFPNTEFDGPRCVSISFLGEGSYNTVYKLAFSNGTEVAASISCYDEDRFNPDGKRSEISTMSFVRESGLYPDVPVPKVLAFDLTFTNPACAPYVLMEVVPGITVDLEDEESDNADATSKLLARDLALVKALAKLQASLFKPVPFDEIGSLFTVTDGKYVVGPLMKMNQRSLDGPFKSIQDLWRLQLHDAMLFALQEWVNNETDNFPRKAFAQPPCTSQLFAELFQLLSSLIPHFQPPKSCMSLVLYHPDIALRNVLFDESSVSSNNPKITGVIDWGGAQILPVMFTARYPGDLTTELHSPFTRLGNPEESWRTVPCDWTSTGDISKWPQGMRYPPNGVPVPIDFGPQVRGKIRRFYLRAYFSACYAEQLHALHGIVDLACLTIFKDAPYYLKFHEVIGGGWKTWVEHETWIRETYWRLRMAGHGNKGSEDVVTGPNVYRESVEGPLCDLGISGEYPVPGY